MKNNIHSQPHFAKFFSELYTFQTKTVDTFYVQEVSSSPALEHHAVQVIMWKNKVGTDMSQMKIR
jgi:hypothetical protein